MKDDFYLGPSKLLPDEIIIYNNVLGETYFISTIIKQYKLNNKDFNNHYEWLKENHPELLI